MFALLGYLIADLCVRLLPDRLTERTGQGLARLVFAVRPKARRAVEANLARLMPLAGPAVRRDHARAAFEHFALSLIDFLRLKRLDPAALAAAIEVRGAPHLDAALRAGRGVIVLSAHFGNWEWGAAYLSNAGARLHLVARPHASPWVEAFFARSRREHGVSVIPGPPLWPAVARALRGGHWVALMGDRGGQGARGSVCAWAAALARRTGALVLPAVMVRLAPGRYAACFEAPLSAEACASGGYRAALDPYFRQYPGQWLAFEPAPEGLTQ